MSKLDSMIISAKIKGMRLTNQLKDSLKTKRPGDSQIVVALVLIAVAIGLCLAFRTEIAKIMGKLFQAITNSIDNLTEEFVITGGD